MTQQSNKDWIDNLIKEYKEEPAYYNCADGLRILLERHKPDYETKIRDLINRYEKDKKQHFDLHGYDIVNGVLGVFIDRLTALLPTKTNETKDL